MNFQRHMEPSQAMGTGLKLTILHELIKYIRCAKIGDLIFRRNLVDFDNSPSIDNYRNYLTQAGYLEIVSRGVYRYIKEIPKDMNYTQLIEEAYGTKQKTHRLL